MTSLDAGSGSLIGFEPTVTISRSGDQKKINMKERYCVIIGLLFLVKHQVN